MSENIKIKYHMNENISKDLNLISQGLKIIRTPIHPIDGTENERLSLLLYEKLIPKEESKKILSQDYCDIFPNFMGFVETYYHLSKLIPHNWTVIDIGCAFNAQCYFFQKHRKIISVEPQLNECFAENLFQANNCDIYRMTGGKFIDSVLPSLDLDMSRTFAIMNNNPGWSEKENLNSKIRSTFKNLYCFFTSGDDNFDKEQF